MKLSELQAKLQQVREAHGDVELDLEYWCEDCGDSHEGKDMLLGMSTAGKLRITVKPLGE